MELFAASDGKWLQINESYKRLTTDEIDAIEVPRLRVVERSNKNFKTLARASAIENDAENRLRLLNRSFPQGNIKKLQQVKTVVYEK